MEKSWSQQGHEKVKKGKVSWVAFIDLYVCWGDQQAEADELHFLLVAMERMFSLHRSIGWRTRVSEKWETLLFLGRAVSERTARHWVPETLSPSGVVLSEGAILVGGGEDDLIIRCVSVLAVKSRYPNSRISVPEKKICSRNCSGYACT